MTSQKICLDSSDTRATSDVSTYNQVSARSETTGSDAISAASREYRFAISEIATISNADRAILIT